MKLSFSPRTGWSRSLRGILDSHDVVFRAPVTDPTYGLPIGNGDSGCLLHLTDSSLKISLNKTDLWDTQNDPDAPYCCVDNEKLTVCRHGGELELDFGCPVFETLYQNRYEGRISLADATANIRNDTPFGKIDLKAFSSEEYGVSAVRLRLSYAEAMSLRASLCRYGSRTLFTWYSNFMPGTGFGLSGTESGCTGDTLIIRQKLHGNAFAVVVKLLTEIPFAITRNGSRRVSAVLEPAEEVVLTLYIGIETAADSETAEQKALGLVNRAACDGYETVFRLHTEAWGAFWQRSFVSLPEKNDYIENLWYLNLYYANSEMKGKSPAHFCNGIWGFYHDFVPWNHFFHYNMQLATFPLEAANHPELLETYYDYRVAELPRACRFAHDLLEKDGAFYTDVADKDGRGEVHTRDNCTCGSQIAMYLYAHYLYSGDRTYLLEKALPVMIETGKFYLSMLEYGPDGCYHIHATQAYEGTPLYDDSITDHAMIRALFSALIRELPESESEPYREKLSKLAPYQSVDMMESEHRDGVFTMGLGKQLPIHGTKVLSVEKSCETGEPVRRTFGDPKYDYYGFPDTEMAPVFPSGLVGIRDRGSVLYDEIYNSVCLHHSSVAGDPDDYCMGWCMMPIYLARMGLPELLQKQFFNTVSTWMIYPQGFGTYGPETNNSQMKNRFETYRVTDLETNEKRTVLSWNFRHFDYETLPILAASVNEMLLQSYDGTLRLFGAVPEEYTCAFSLRAQGGFTVHAVYENGNADVWILSERGGDLSVILDSVSSPVSVSDEEGRKLSTLVCDGTVTVRTDPGMWVRFTAGEGASCEREYRRNTGMKTMGNSKLGNDVEYD